MARRISATRDLHGDHNSLVHCCQLSDPLNLSSIARDSPHSFQNLVPNKTNSIIKKVKSSHTEPSDDVATEASQITLADIEPGDEASDSTTLITTLVPEDHTEPRKYYLENLDQSKPPLITHSSIVPRSLANHLIMFKKDKAIKEKFKSNRSPPDQITNMEGAMHTLVIPIVQTVIHGDTAFTTGAKFHGHTIALAIPSGQHQRGRVVLLSATVQLDFALDTVVVAVAALGREKVVGRPTCPSILSVSEKQKRGPLCAYEKELRRYMVQHLTLSGVLPAIETVEHDTKGLEEMILELDTHILSTDAKDLPLSFQNLYLSHVGQKSRKTKQDHPTTMSVEILFQMCAQQIQTEFSLLQQRCQKTGWIHTFDPPVLFALFLGDDFKGTKFLSRVYLAALKYVSYKTQFSSLRAFGWNDFNDTEALNLLECALAEQRHRPETLSKSRLFNGTASFNLPQGTYNPPDGLKGAMLVIHNNSDAFGQNIENEPRRANETFSSLDGVIGWYSSAAASLERSRPDLCKYGVEIPALAMK